MDDSFPITEERVKSARVVQRCWRRKLAVRSGKLRLSLWPSLQQLRGAYLDESAIKAGALDSEYYTDEMIVTREALKKHEVVKEAIEDAWEGMCAACGQSKEGYLGYDDYCVMSRKLYLLFKAQERDGYIDATDAVESIEADWDADAGGKPYMDYDDFHVGGAGHEPCC